MKNSAFKININVIHKLHHFLLSFVVLILSINLVIAQNNIYVLGNLNGTKLPERLTQFEGFLHQEQNGKPFTLLLLGDVRQDLPENTKILSDFLKKVKEKGAEIIAVTGDLDWDNSGYYGLDTVSSLQKSYKKLLGENIFFPKNDCPGPYVKDIGDDIRIIAINSQWWLHPYRKVLPIDSECKEILKIEILDELDAAIENAGNRKVIFITHHPVTSGGVYGGNSNFMGQFFPFSHSDPDNKTFIPLYGTFYHCYRQNIGSVQDLSNDQYQLYIKEIKDVLLKHENVVMCSAHEYDMQLLNLNYNYQIISGNLVKSAQVSALENTIFKTNNTGFVKLEIQKNTPIVSKFFVLDKKENNFELAKSVVLESKKKTHIFKNKIKSNAELKHFTNDSIVAGDYKASKFKQLFFGSLYRDAWTTPVTIPTLDLDTTFGGLTPLKKGGGLQTISLQFVDKDGRKYAFRSIDKTPIKAIPFELRIDLVANIMQDMTATQHPYGALFVAKLLDATNLYHGTPKLYIMPDSEKLGDFRSQFSGMYGMLEPKPTELDDITKSYQQADQVKSSLSLLQKIYKSPKTNIDTMQYAEARVVDILIGDWDRHQDNWKWIGYKNEQGITTYKPYPKDRDHAFSRMNGFFYYLADRDWAIPFRENFNNHFTGIKSLTIKGSHLDRLLLSGMDKQAWLKAAKTINAQITDEVIDDAKLAFPEPLQEKSGKEIAEKLKKRKTELNKAVEKHYLLLSKEVDIVGTNKAEFFKINRLPSGAVEVSMYAKEDTSNVLLNRTFYPNETKEIRLFGLAKADSFYVYGTSNKSILVRIMGGDGNDNVIDESNVRFGTKKTLIYDYPNNVLTEKSKETRTILSEKSRLNEFDQDAFKYNTYLPIPLLVVNPDDGFGGGINLQMKRFGYANKLYKTLHDVKLFSTTGGSNYFSLQTERNIGNSDFYLNGNAELGAFFPFYSFYGVGNKTVLVDSLEDAGYYKARYQGAILKGGITYRFLRRSFISLNAVSELLSKGHSDQSFFDVFPNPQLEPTNATGGEIKFDLDFRDSPSFTTKGIRVTLENKSLFTTSKAFGKTSAEISYYSTTRIVIPITLGVKAGTERTFGKNIPFYHLASIGQSYHLRGYLQNRFSGEATNYVNTDLRFHLGKSKSSFLPMYYGLNAFLDVGQIVENESFTEKKWHNGYGGGIYLTPISKDYITIQVNVEYSDEQKAFLKIGLGLII
ncbi:MAG: hypothetical protein RQ875_00275 [Vicingaceae bacterium]|nr:hypothetical protein [Vicingaceae bacterium]